MVNPIVFMRHSDGNAPTYGGSANSRYAFVDAACPEDGLRGHAVAKLLQYANLVTYPGTLSVGDQ
jgi:hypothetical protein